HGTRVHRHRHADAGIRARELLEHEHIREEVRTGAAVLLRDADAHQSGLGQLPEELAREPLLPVPLRGVRLDLRLRELARQRLDLALLGRQAQVHDKTLVAAERGPVAREWYALGPRARARSDFAQR